MGDSGTPRSRRSLDGSGQKGAWNMSPLTLPPEDDDDDDAGPPPPPPSYAPPEDGAKTSSPLASFLKTSSIPFSNVVTKPFNKLAEHVSPKNYAKKSE